MSLSNLTSRGAVLQATQEFDQLGRGAFLARYGFGKAQTYFLRHEGSLYDSKAIAGVAYGYQYPERGPLHRDEFSGGESTVVKKLDELGFEVIRLEEIPARPAETPYWALCANPHIYDIDTAVSVLETDWWTVGRSDIRHGDRVAIWRTAGLDGRRGIIALGEVISESEIRSDSSNPFWRTVATASELKPRVLVRYQHSPNLPLWADTETGAVLHDLSVYKARGGTVFKITPEQWSELMRIAGDISQHSPEEEEIIRIAKPRPPRRAQGQGRGLSGPERLVIEKHAMGIAIDHYKRNWQIVEDISANASCDLICKNGPQRLYVEVKGTTGAGQSVLLTPNEVTLSEDHYPDTALFVVSNIQLHQTDAGEHFAEGGESQEIKPWRAKDHNLRPTSYECKLSI